MTEQLFILFKGIPLGSINSREWFFPHTILIHLLQLL